MISSANIWVGILELLINKEEDNIPRSHPCKCREKALVKCQRPLRPHLLMLSISAIMIQRIPCVIHISGRMWSRCEALSLHRNSALASQDCFYLQKVIEYFFDANHTWLFFSAPSSVFSPHPQGCLRCRPRVQPKNWRWLSEEERVQKA